MGLPVAAESEMKKDNCINTRKQKGSPEAWELRISPLQPEDCGQGADLLDVCFSDPWSRKALEEACEREDYLQLGAYLLKQAEAKDKRPALIGYAGLKMVLDEGDVTNICVHPDKRQGGIGKTLLETLLAMAADRGIRAVYLEVRLSNQAAIHMYQAAGFEEIGKRKDFYEKPREDALLMMWNLES